MFGLEKQKKANEQEFSFDLELTLQKNKEQRDLKKRAEEQIQAIKKELRSGENKENFDRYGVLLHGYTSFLKVMARFRAK